jgi:chemotaxis protein methyltransferase CheR
VAAVATNETYFFRTWAQFKTLKSYLLPELCRAKISRGKRALRAWSAGCSSGEEPYSLAILLRESLPDSHAWEVSILATDIDLDALKRAQEGHYGSWSFRETGAEAARKYLNPEKGRYRVDDRIRSWVTFRPLNLKSDPYPSLLNGTTDLDIILCRNVTIYFRPETTLAVVRRFHECLNEGGFLLTGAAEYSLNAYQDFEARVFPEAIIYQKPAAKEQISIPRVVPPALPRLPTGDTVSPPPQETKIDRAGQKNGAKEPVDRALELISQGETDKAMVLLAGQAEKNPQDSRAPFLLGQISADRRHLQEAAYWLSRTIALDPLHLWAHYLLGLLWIEEGKSDEALQSFKKTVYIDPNFALGHFYVGRLYREQGQLKRARSSFVTVRTLLSSAPLSESPPGAGGMTAEQLLTLIDEELKDGQ